MKSCARPSNIAAPATARSRSNSTPERFFGHFEGDPQRYRGKGELDRIREQRDCLKAFRKRVLEAGLLTEEALDQVDADVMTLIEESVDDARVGTVSLPEQVLEDVYISY